MANKIFTRLNKATACRSAFIFMKFYLPKYPSAVVDKSVAFTKEQTAIFAIGISQCIDSQTCSSLKLKTILAHGSVGKG